MNTETNAPELDWRAAEQVQASAEARPGSYPPGLAPAIGHLIARDKRRNASEQRLAEALAAGQQLAEALGEIVDAEIGAESDLLAGDEYERIDAWNALRIACKVDAGELGVGALIAEQPRAAEAKADRAQLAAAREWLCERTDGVAAIYEQQTPHWLRERVNELYPANTPGQDGWSSFCEDWAAGTLAPARRADALDAATGQSRR